MYAIRSYYGPNKLKELTQEVMKGLPAMVNGSPIAGTIDMDAIVKIAWTLMILYVSAFVLNYLQSFLMATITQIISKKMRTDISQKINRLPLKYFDSSPRAVLFVTKPRLSPSLFRTLNTRAPSATTRTLTALATLTM